MNIDPLTIDFVRDLILRKETTATALTEEFYKKIESEDSKIHAFLTLSKDRAFAKATEIDGMADRGEELPPMAGVPVGIKDVFMTRGIQTTAGSRILEDFVAPYDSTAVARLESANRASLLRWRTDCERSRTSGSAIFVHHITATRRFTR